MILKKKYNLRNCSVSVISGENQLKEFSEFLYDHHSALSDIISKNQAVTTNEVIRDETSPVIINANNEFLRLNSSSSIKFDFTHSAEVLPTMDLIHSANKCLNKTIAVFVQLCMEVRELCKEGNQLLKDCLLAYDELCELFQNGEKTTTDISSSHYERAKLDKIPLTTNALSRVCSKIKPFFQVQQFKERCFGAISEIINQFTALFNIDNGSSINVDYSSLHFQVSKCQMIGSEKN